MKFTIPVVSLLAGCLAVTLICNSIWAYHDRIPTLMESEDLPARYAPLSANGNLATPDQPPTLKPWRTVMIVVSVRRLLFGFLGYFTIL